MFVVLTAVYARDTILKEHQDAPAAAVRTSGRNIRDADSLPAVLSRETWKPALSVLIGQSVKR